MANARRDLIVVTTLISAVAMLIWNGSSFVQRLINAEGEYSSTVKVAAVAMTLNVALILFGWRRYADLSMKPRSAPGTNSARSGSHRPTA